MPGECGRNCVHEVRRDRVTEVVDLFGERISEARKASHLHTHGEVLALDKAG